MTDIKDVLDGFANFYNYARQVGHTRAALNGVKYSKATLIVHNRVFLPREGINTMLFDDVEKLTGMRDFPIVFDNGALHVIFRKAASRINYLESMNKKLIIENTNLLNK